jgi:hypothetical protein
VQISRALLLNIFLMLQSQNLQYPKAHYLHTCSLAVLQVNPPFKCSRAVRKVKVHITKHIEPLMSPFRALFGPLCRLAKCSLRTALSQFPGLPLPFSGHLRRLTVKILSLACDGCGSSGKAGHVCNSGLIRDSCAMRWAVLRSLSITAYPLVFSTPQCRHLQKAIKQHTHALARTKMHLRFYFGRMSDQGSKTCTFLLSNVSRHQPILA